MSRPTRRPRLDGAGARPRARKEWRSRIRIRASEPSSSRTAAYVGEGFHVYDQRDHAEIVALRAARQRKRAAPLSTSLSSPAATPDAPGRARKPSSPRAVKRVVAAMPDPNPAVAGTRLRGVAPRRHSGRHRRARSGRRASSNEDFAKWIRTGLPFVTLKSGAHARRPHRRRAGQQRLRSPANASREDCAAPAP